MQSCGQTTVSRFCYQLLIVHPKRFGFIAMGCRRVVIDSGYFDALHKPNVKMTTDAIEKFTENGIVTNKGESC